MKYLLRQLNENDVRDAMDLVWRVFSEFEAPEYSEEGVLEFKKFIDSDSIKEKIQNNELTFSGAFEKSKIIGVIAARNKAHITLLFVDKQYHRQGVARSLFNMMLNNLEAGEKTVTVNSSPYAFEAYKRLGFVPTDTEQTKNGIRYIPMKFTI